MTPEIATLAIHPMVSTLSRTTVRLTSVYLKHFLPLICGIAHLFLLTCKSKTGSDTIDSLSNRKFDFV